MTRRRKPLPPDPNPFIQKHLERQVAEMLAAEGMVPIDVNNLPAIRSSKPSPARAPSAGRADAMAARARQRKTQRFVDKKRLQQATRKEAHDE